MTKILGEMTTAALSTLWKAQQEVATKRSKLQKPKSEPAEKANAFVDNERREAKALLREVTSLVEKSMALRDHAAKNPKPKLPRLNRTRTAPPEVVRRSTETNLMSW